jgi:hypothetical protein
LKTEIKCNCNKIDNQILRNVFGCYFTEQGRKLRDSRRK